MAAHKPVEWVQAVITRFDEQVRWVDSLDGCSNPRLGLGPGSPVTTPGRLFVQTQPDTDGFPSETSFPTGMRSLFLSRLQNTEEAGPLLALRSTIN